MGLFIVFCRGNVIWEGGGGKGAFVPQQVYGEEKVEDTNLKWKKKKRTRYTGRKIDFTNTIKGKRKIKRCAPYSYRLPC